VTTTPTLDDRAHRYLEEVRGHLVDLTAGERDALVGDLAGHLHEVSSTDDRPLDEVLGTPAAFAAELRASAGLPPETPLADADADALADADAARPQRSFADHPWTEATRAFLVELRPAWWVARGVLVVLVLGLVLGAEIEPILVPVLVAGAVVSVLVGRRERTSRLARPVGWAIAAVVIVVVYLALTGSVDSDGSVDPVGEDDPAPPLPAEPGLTHIDGRQITNIYAYDHDGRPIEDVLLYDQNGEPLDPGSDLFDAEGRRLDTTFPLDSAGAEVRNSFPLDQRVITGDADGRERGVAVPDPPVVVPPAPEG